ncbi:MAG: family 1 glycosylhydrolase, partial [Candidatus Obscuribacterales bacterium]|nr:family 1 glycosylhydrolase [Candidatus Obscuribacterales bacterium]
MATSHFQVEGNPKEMSGRLSDWSMWTNCDGKIIDKTNADQACEFFSRYKDDLQLCQNMGLNAFRLSLNWAALVPLPNAPLDREMVDYYRKVLTELRSKGMKS